MFDVSTNKGVSTKGFDDECRDSERLTPAAVSNTVGVEPAAMPVLSKPAFLNCWKTAAGDNGVNTSVDSGANPVVVAPTYSVQYNNSLPQKTNDVDTNASNSSEVAHSSAIVATCAHDPVACALSVSAVVPFAEKLVVVVVTWLPVVMLLL